MPVNTKQEQPCAAWSKTPLPPAVRCKERQYPLMDPTAMWQINELQMSIKFTNLHHKWT